ncbi:FecR family protein [Thalassospira australica]|uniref:FecR family protein n=1 Tax=Thalassospira australica TaxID=1528106 RepID=UPI00384E24EB
MAANTDAIPPQASREATDWLILLQEEPDDQDILRAFAQWCDADPAHMQAWDATRRAADVMAAGAPEHAARWQPFVHEMRAGSNGSPVSSSSRKDNVVRPAFGRRKMLLGGGMAIAASLFAAVVGPGIVARAVTGWQADYVTDTAEMRTITLADASTVTMAPESAIRVRFEAGERHVALLGGEAFFDVTPDPKRPFRVSSDDVDVTVLGTGFDVRRNDAGTLVAVEHGLVRVGFDAINPPVDERLAAGQSASVTWQGAVARGSLPAGQIASWRQNQLIAQDQPLGTVIDGLRRYYPGRIIITDDALAARTVTGVYNLADPLAALRGIARAQDAVVRQVTPWILLVSAS